MESDASSARYLFFIRRTNDYINMDNDEGKKKEEAWNLRDPKAVM